MKNWVEQNTEVIKEFQKNEGRVGGVFEGAPMILVHTIGAKSGQERTVPLMYLADGDRYALFASKAGSPTHPDWYYNMVANPKFTVEVGVEQFEVTATIAEEPERTILYGQMATSYPAFARYAEEAKRVIPVVILTRQSIE